MKTLALEEWRLGSALEALADMNLSVALRERERVARTQWLRLKSRALALLDERVSTKGVASSRSRYSTFSCNLRAHPLVASRERVFGVVPGLRLVLGSRGEPPRHDSRKQLTTSEGPA
jgi:hypothetical protein